MSYPYYILDDSRFHGKRHPCQLGIADIRGYLTHLAGDKHVAASTQNLALSALFLYQEVLRFQVPFIEGVEWARRPKRLPSVFTRDEARRILKHTDGVRGLILRLLYGTGMRLEGLRLRVKDVEFADLSIVVRDGKANKDRITMLPEALVPALQEQLRHASNLHGLDLAEGCGEVEMPHALARKYPQAVRSWAWQYVFPSERRSTDPRSGRQGRHHIYPNTIQRAMKEGMSAAGVLTPAELYG
jgi:integron integrase